MAFITKGANLQTKLWLSILLCIAMQGQGGKISMEIGGDWSNGMCPSIQAGGVDECHQYVGAAYRF